MQGVSRWEFIFVKLKSAKIAAGKSLAEKEETRTRPIEDAPIPSSRQIYRNIIQALMLIVRLINS
jgi:hypothetical protein